MASKSFRQSEQVLLKIDVRPKSDLDGRAAEPQTFGNRFIIRLPAFSRKRCPWLHRLVLNLLERLLKLEQARFAVHNSLVRWKPVDHNRPTQHSLSESTLGVAEMVSSSVAP